MKVITYLVLCQMGCSLIQGRSLLRQDDVFSSEPSSISGHAKHLERYNDIDNKDLLATEKAIRSLLSLNPVVERLLGHLWENNGNTNQRSGNDEASWADASSEDRVGNLAKKAFDSISGVSTFGGFKKRAFDSIAGLSNFGGFRKRAFDSISGVSGFGGFKKRKSDGASGRSTKRAFDSIAGASDFGGFGKRSFDSIEHRSFFGGFGKRTPHTAGRGWRSTEPQKKGTYAMMRRGLGLTSHVTSFGGFENENDEA